MGNVSDKYVSILRQYWGHSDFRGIQRDIIGSIGSGHDTLGLMPTGGGKSITFQVPALAAEGVCIVITPLIALMKDQVYNLRRRGIMAAAIYSGMTRREILHTLENCILGSTKILYVSPERIASELFKTKLRHMRVSFITVDEAHCISQWGYDFRPSYLHIADIRDIKPDIPVLALTATATGQVVDDIQKKLKFTEANVFRMSFERKNLAYIVRHATDKREQMIHILRSVEGSAIVYVRSRKRASEISDLLNQNNVEATYYHAGLEHSVKDERQKEWHDDKKRVMVATNAFGMGIDKPDVRVVIHFDCPSSLEAYFQEAGRAGRDGQKSYAVLLYNNSDKSKLQKRIADEFPEKEYIRSVYDHLAGFFQIAVNSGRGHAFMFDIRKFCRTYKLFPIQTDAALKILERAGYIEYDADPHTEPRIMFLLSRQQLYMLNELSPLEERLVTTLLRNYGTLFNDYTYIDEEMIANQAHTALRATLQDTHHNIHARQSGRRGPDNNARRVRRPQGAVHQTHKHSHKLRHQRRRMPQPATAEILRRDTVGRLRTVRRVSGTQEEAQHEATTEGCQSHDNRIAQRQETASSDRTSETSAAFRHPRHGPARACFRGDDTRGRQLYTHLTRAPTENNRAKTI